MRSITGGKIVPTSVKFYTEKNRPIDLVAVPSAVGVIGPASPFFVQFSQPISPAAAMKVIKVSNNSAMLLNKSILNTIILLLPLQFIIL